MDNELLVKSIRNLCKENNVTVSQLESELHFGAGLISRWSKSSPSLDKIIAIARYFDVSLDEAVGYKNNFEDDFLITVLERTSDDRMVWNKSDRKYNDDFLNKQYYINDYGSYSEQSYYSKFKKGYIVIHGLYNEYDITRPKHLKLFVKPDEGSKLICQKYSSNELLKLWLGILYNLGDSSPDEIKAEIFKNDFILNEIENRDLMDQKVFATLNGSPGCFLYDNNLELIMKRSDLTPPTDENALLFYKNNRKIIGHIKYIEMKNGYKLFLISASHVMKLEGFLCGKNASDKDILSIHSFLSSIGAIKPIEYFRKNSEFEIIMQ